MHIKLTNMVMIQDPLTGKILALDRVKDWCGLSFPGGHVEPGESFVKSAEREAHEETGLTVTNLIGCGVLHWTNLDNHDRYLSFLYKTTNFTGDLIHETKEGKNLWLSAEELSNAPSTNGLHEILKMFLNDNYSEAFGSWDSGGNWKLTDFF